MAKTTCRYAGQFEIVQSKYKPTISILVNWKGSILLLDNAHLHVANLMFTVKSVEILIHLDYSPDFFPVSCHFWQELLQS